MFLSYVAVLFTPIVGFAAGIFLLIRGRRGHGIAVVLISVAMVVAALAVPEGSTDHHLREAHARPHH